jgi:hypothetical protein
MTISEAQLSQAFKDIERLITGLNEKIIVLTLANKINIKAIKIIGRYIGMEDVFESLRDSEEAKEINNFADSNNKDIVK